MGKHKHKKSKKSKKSSRDKDSSDEWEETTVPDEETFITKARSKMKMPRDDEQEDLSSTNVHRSQSSSGGSWRKQERGGHGPESGSATETQTEPDVNEKATKLNDTPQIVRINPREALKDSASVRAASVEATKEEKELIVESENPLKERTSEPSTPRAGPEQQHLERRSKERVRNSPPGVSGKARGSDADAGTQATEILSDDKMNQLSAKILKAELRDDRDTVKRLKTKLEAATKARLEAQQSVDDTETTVIIITKDRNESSGGHKRYSSASAGRSNKKKTRSEDAWERLEDKFVRKKVEDDEKMDAVLQRAINKIDAASSREITGADEDHDQLDDQDQESLVASVHQNTIKNDRKKAEEFMEHCHFCVDSSSCMKHLIVYSGENVSLMLPRNGSLTDFHCLLVPKEHLPILTQTDEDTWSEMQVLRKLLSDLFQAEEMDCVFLQTTTAISRRAHAVMHCVPIPNESADMMPMYFKKAIEECETEWSMNKKLVRLSDGGVRSCIPKGLPYFAVDFGKQNGYAHVIEDRERFPDYFGLEIIGSVLDVTPSTWLKPRSESFQDQSKKVISFENLWTKHECEKKLTS